MKTKQKNTPIKKQTHISEQKLTVLAALIVIVFLAGLIFWRQSSFRLSNTIRSHDTQSKTTAEEYRKLLEALKPDKEASAKLLKQVINEDDLRKEMEAEFKVDQAINQPQVRNSEINIISKQGRDAVVKYFRDTAGDLKDFNNSVIPVSGRGFQANTTRSELTNAIAVADVYIAKLGRVETPSEAVPFHKAQLITAFSHKRLLEKAREYRDSLSDEVWPEVYREFVIANNQLEIIDEEYKDLDKVYNIGQVAINDSSNGFAVENILGIKTAQAQFGGPVTVIANVPEAIKDGIKQGLASAFGRFATKFLEKLITLVEKNYKIANFIYYADTLTRAQYVPDYLDKYVTDPLDQAIVKGFIPQFACGSGNAELKPLLKAKAEEYLGFEVGELDPNDPDVEIKIARVGEYLSNPSGWESYFAGVADGAIGASETAITRELTSSGLKSPRDLIGQQIDASLNVIEGSQVAALIAGLQLGSVNAENLISQLVAGVIDNLVTKFALRGVVYQEEVVCVNEAVLNPVVATDVDPVAAQGFNPATPALR